MSDDPKKPAVDEDAAELPGESEGRSSGDTSPADTASPPHADPAGSERVADLPGDEGLRALYAQLPDVAPRAGLDEAILAASREALRGAGDRGESGAMLRGAFNRTRPARRASRERATRFLRWGLPVAAAASVMFVVLREHGELVPQAEFGANTASRDEFSASPPPQAEFSASPPPQAELPASPPPREKQASKPKQEEAGRLPESQSGLTAPAEQAERDRSASPEFAPSAPPPSPPAPSPPAPSAPTRSAPAPTAESKRKTAPISPGARSAARSPAREAYDSSAVGSDERRMADAPPATNDGRGISAPPLAGSAESAVPPLSAPESANLAISVPPAKENERPSAPAAAIPSPKDTASITSGVGALASMDSAPGFSITEADKPWPLGLEFAMSTETACAKLRALSSRGCVLHNGVAVVEFDEPRRLTSGVHEGRWIVAVKMTAMDGVITKLDLTERPERKE